MRLRTAQKCPLKRAGRGLKDPTPHIYHFLKTSPSSRGRAKPNTLYIWELIYEYEGSGTSAKPKTKTSRSTLAGMLRIDSEIYAFKSWGVSASFATEMATAAYLNMERVKLWTKRYNLCRPLRHRLQNREREPDAQDGTFDRILVAGRGACRTRGQWLPGARGSQ